MFCYVNIMITITYQQPGGSMHGRPGGVWVGARQVVGKPVGGMHGCPNGSY